jgi:hypothetical protein
MFPRYRPSERVPIPERRCWSAISALRQMSEVSRREQACRGLAVGSVLPCDPPSRPEAAIYYKVNFREVMD